MLDELEKNESIGEPSVEEVQDTVERVLIENGFVRTAKSYILYRAERSRIREMNTRLMRIYEDITNKAAIDSDIKRENAISTAIRPWERCSSTARRAPSSSTSCSCSSPNTPRRTATGISISTTWIFLTLTTTCCQIDLIKLFENGFSTGHGYLREPNDIYSYFGAGLHRHTGQPERPARRPVYRQL